MNNRVKRFGVLVMIPLALILGGCGWEPLIPQPEPQPEEIEDQAVVDTPITEEFEVAIQSDCENCISSQADGEIRAEVPVTYTFTADITIPNPNVESVIHYSWNFGDGTFGEGEKITHTFEEVGTYRVNLKAITSSGNEATDEYIVIAYPRTSPSEKVRTVSREGMLCSFTRTVPEEIVENEPFKVQVVIETHAPVQVIQWEDVSWFPGFRLKQEPIGLWKMVPAGHRISLEYDVELWQEVKTESVYMTGETKCNKGGFGESEILELRSDLTIFTSDEH